MTKEDLQKVNQLLVKLEECKKELTHLDYVLSDSFVERDSYMNYLNNSLLENTIVIPEAFQKLIAKMLYTHYTAEAAKIDGQIDALLS